MAETESCVLVVDDDADVREGLTWLLKSCELPSRAFDGFVPCRNVLFDYLAGPAALCMLLDIRMAGMSGLEAFQDMLHVGVNLKRLPVIFLTGHGDIATAVNAVQNGAFDFFEKPATDNRLVDRICAALDVSREEMRLLASSSSIEDRLALLSEREREVMMRVARGQMNKNIAVELSVSMRTVEVHRARVFEKLGVKSAPELAVYLTQAKRL